MGWLSCTQREREITYRMSAELSQFGTAGVGQRGIWRLSKLLQNLAG